jgi:hypothetical protein
MGTDMRAFLRALRVDLAKALLGRWFVIAVLATLFSLWLGISQQLRGLDDYLMYNDEPHWAGMLHRALQGSFAQLSLPALSALPAAGLALLELQAGAARSALFRVGWQPYRAGKVIVALAGGMAVQAAGIGLLMGLMHAIRLHALGAPIPWAAWQGIGPPVLARIVCGGIWSGAGSLLALLTGTASAATVGPLCLCYGLMMVGTRFFPDMAWVNPLTWLGGASWLLWAVLGAVVLLLWAVQGRKVRQHV